MSTYLGSKKVNVGVYIETDRVVLSADEFAALEVKDPNTMYLVYDDPVLVDIMRHMEDKDIHVTSDEKEKWNNVDFSDLEEQIETLQEQIETLQNQLANSPVHTYGTEDLVSGESYLAPGTFYHVYE